MFRAEFLVYSGGKFDAVWFNEAGIGPQSLFEDFASSINHSDLCLWGLADALLIERAAEPRTNGSCQNQRTAFGQVLRCQFLELVLFRSRDGWAFLNELSVRLGRFVDNGYALTGPGHRLHTFQRHFLFPEDVTEKPAAITPRHPYQ